MSQRASPRRFLGIAGALVFGFGLGMIPPLPTMSGTHLTVIDTAYACHRVQKYLPLRNAYHRPYYTSTPVYHSGYTTTKTIWHPPYTTYKQVKVSSGHNKTVTVTPGHYKTVSQSTPVPGHWSTQSYTVPIQETTWVTKTVQQTYLVPVQKTVKGWHQVTQTVWKSVGSGQTGSTGTIYPIGLPTWMAPWGNNPNAGQASSTGGQSTTGSSSGSGGQQLVPVQETTEVYGPYQTTVYETAHRSVTTQVPVTRTVDTTESKKVWVPPSTKTTTSQVWVPAVTKQVWVPPRYKSVPVHHPGYNTYQQVYHPPYTTWKRQYHAGYWYTVWGWKYVCA